MPIEIEAKMKLRDPAAMEHRLVEAGAELRAKLLETNTFFDTPQRSLKSADRGLRVRVEQDTGAGTSRVVITHKGPRAHGKLKSRAETELEVSSAEDAARLLGVLGFEAVLGFEKKRTRWVLDGCHVAMDTVPYVGDFIEVEGPTDKAVLDVRDKLGLADEPLIRASYIAMISTYLDEHNLRLRHVAFGGGE